ncbi:hypothetical protein [Anaerotignum sp.]|uniref:hypothetical protein n=1 Tax=Anaerotignum sp. TaxID=2039241 RepID=UPI0027154D46|nr:hypothetical protein [Anaerotignum sp.]
MLEAIKNRELGIMEILSISINLLIKNFRPIMVVVIMLFFPISILNAMILDKLSTSTAIVMNLIESGEAFENFSAHSSVFLDFFENHALQMAVLLFLEPIGVISVAKITKNYINNEPIHVKDAIGEALNCLWKVIITGIPCCLLIFAATLFFIIPGIYLGVIWTFYIYAIGLKEIKGWKALEYSRKLTQGKFWKTLLFLIVISFVTAGWDWIISNVCLLLPEHIGTDILYFTLTYISGSFAFIAMTVLFMNREVVLLGNRYMPTEYATEDASNEDKN